MIRGHVRKCLTRLPAGWTFREMVTKTLQLKRAQFAYRREYRKFFKAFVLGALAKARFHTLPVSLLNSSSELSFVELPPPKVPPTLSAPPTRHPHFHPILSLHSAQFHANSA